ncbi:MAG TPA: tRNA (guanosine(46)-N7)-methyltransferase TrmB [Candidatus Saccharimonadales bacterium]
MSEPIDLNQFVITRRRKKYKFAKFANSPLCFELDEWQSRAVDVIELGAGTGLFAVQLAERYPDQQFVAIDVKADRLQKGAYEAEAKGLTNVRFVRARGDQLSKIVPPQSLSAIWLTFPDPFPKKGSAGRRMTNKTYLSTYTKMLKSDGHLYIKHDDPAFFTFSLEQLVACRWTLDQLTFDLHDSDLSDDYKLLTTYETRWLGEGKPTQLVAASPPSLVD